MTKDFQPTLADLPDVADWTAEDYKKFAFNDHSYLPDTHEQLPNSDNIEFYTDEEVDEMNTAERLEHEAYMNGLKDAIILLYECEKNGDSLQDAITEIKKLIASTK